MTYFPLNCTNTLGSIYIWPKCTYNGRGTADEDPIQHA